jgi:hypothetical protein
MAFNANMGDSYGDPFGYTWPGSLTPYSDATGRTTVSPTLAAERTAIFIIDGQSLASNHCACSYTVLNPTKVQSVNWAGDRLLYRHQEPCFGGSFWDSTHLPANNVVGFYTSIWGKVGDLLIGGGIFDRVIFFNVSAGGQTAGSIAPGGSLGQRLPMAFHVLRSLGYSGNQVSAVLSMLGESDGVSATDPALWKSQRRAAIDVTRDFGFTGPWIIPQETYVSGVSYPAIRTAQAELAAEGGNALGPDFDALGSSYRGADNIHQNLAGRDAMAQMWLETLSAQFTTHASSSVRRLHYR